MKPIFFALPLSVLLLAVVPTSATTLYVDVNSTNPIPPYTNWSTAANVIQAAVDAADPGDEVLVTNGTYLLPAEITVVSDIMLRSVNGPSATSIDGGGKVRCLNLGTNACVVNGFTITHGFSVSGYAGGVWCKGEEPILTNCVIAANVAHAEGGGMVGGTAYNCLFIGNSSPLGGGMEFGTANNCLFIENSANYRGGGMYEGIANNCTFTRNHSVGDGGGLCGGIANNCTITANTADNEGGGVVRIWANNCIIYSNTAGVAGNDIQHGDSVFNSCSPDLVDGVDGNITNAPLLVSIGHIATNSPCRATGDYAYTSGTDIDGQPWLNPPSMGCDENAGAGSVTGAVIMSLLGPDRIVAGATADYTPLFNGPVTGTRVDFGDGQVEVNPITSVAKVWPTPGSYEVVLTAYNDDHVSGITFTQMVQVVSVPEGTVYVSGDTGSDANDGSSWPMAKQTIQAGVDAQEVYGGTVLVTNRTYLLSSEIVVNKVVRLESVNGPKGTVIDGGGVVRCLNLGASACTVSGFTITNGFKGFEAGWLGSGGGVYCIDLTPMVTNCLFIGNKADEGGGMFRGTASDCIFDGNSAANEGGGAHSSTVNNCEFKGNSAFEYGGGLSECIANDCTFTGNSTQYGGGGMNQGTASHCTFISNTALNGGGGGIQQTTANDCTMIGNIARFGGGLVAGTANNCIVLGNSALEEGGGMMGGFANNSLFADNWAGSYGGGGLNETWANNCTVIGNSTDGDGGGVLYGTTYNCIIYSNTAGVSGNDIPYGDYVFNSCSPDLTDGVDGNITNTPLLVSIGHIATNSPCRAAGDYAYASGTDIDGQPWLNPPSMGCDENAGAGSVTGTVAISLLGPERIVVGESADYTPLFNGPVTGTRVDFGDGQVEVNPITSIAKVWSTPGDYEVVLTAHNDDHVSGMTFTQMVQVVSVPEGTVYVSGDTGSDANDGSSWAMAKQTIQAGVDAQAVYGGSVLVTNGAYSLSSEIRVNKVVRLESVNGPNGTVIDGGGVVRCLNLGASACTVSGFTITNGFAEGYYTGNGGGVYCSTPDPTATNCILTDNLANNGAAMYYGTADNCIFVGNTALSSGGGLARSTALNCLLTNNAAASSGGGIASGLADNCILIHNMAGSGGGMHAGLANNCDFIENTATVNGGGANSSTANHCKFTGNSATPHYPDGDGGGGMHEGRANHCTFTKNIGTVGGGVFETSVSNCVIFGNTADYAGGVYVYGGEWYSPNVVNCTIVGNFASNEFGGIFVRVATNCIIFYNTSPGSVQDDAGGLRQSCCSPDLAYGVNGNITNAPLFVDTNNWSDLRLQSNSPCINAGNNAYVTSTTDLDGNPRIVGGTVDMGAYEFQSPQSSISYAYLQQYSLPTDGSVDDLDQDDDRATTWQEWKMWTNPTDELSVLRMLSPQTETNGTLVRWESVDGHSYFLERATNAAEPFSLLQSNILGQPGMTSFTDTNEVGEGPMLYRVGVPE